MSRFSIRIQLFFLASAFVVALVTVSGMSWAIKARLQNNLSQDRELFVQEASLREILIKIDEAESAILGYALGKEEGWANFTTRWEEGHEAIEASINLLVNSQHQNGGTQAMIDELQAISESLRALEPHFDEVESEALFGQTDSVRNLLQPVFLATNQRLSQLIAHAQEELEASLERTQNSISKSNIAVLSVSGMVILVTLFATYFFGRALVSPIDAAAQTVSQLANKDFSAKICGADRKDELGQILRNLACLRDELRTADEQQRQAQRENDLRIDLFQAFSASLGYLRSGDLSHRMVVNDWQELGSEYVMLCQDYNNLCVALDEMVSELRNSARTVESSANGLAEMSSDMSHRAESQAATLEESAASLEELSERVQQSATRAQEAKELVVEGRRRAEEGGGVMQDALEAMSSIAKSSDQITQIIDVIDDIAFQTNLLSLNAGVEAARAGETGRGFAVVASEVRSLAQRAAESANEIKTLVLNSTQQVQEGQELVTATSETLGHIVESVNVVSDAVSAIAENAVEQANSVQEVNVGVGELEKVTQENTLGVRQTKDSSQGLSSEAMRLTDLLSKFRGFGEADTRPSDDVQTVETPPNYGEIVLFDEADLPEPPQRQPTVTTTAEPVTPATEEQHIPSDDTFNLASAFVSDDDTSPVPSKKDQTIAPDASSEPEPEAQQEQTSPTPIQQRQTDQGGDWQSEIDRIEDSEVYQPKDAKAVNKWEDF
ncbi:MAG: methyl-accepting chemotaxis protein [Pelagimonas sp.]|nr:methyl-accepting chemotaxis protein [Pelagimonas sp.]